MANPLNKRFTRELRNNLGKYLGMFLMMAFATAFTSGYLLAASSIQQIIEEMPETYRIEDGRFSCDFEPDDGAIEAVEDLGVTVYPDFYRQVDLQLEDGQTAGDITARVYANRTELNLAAYAQGSAPATDDEVALDRVFMENHDLQLGDSVMLDGRPLTISGVVTLPDYQGLFSNNNDFLFDAITFTVAQVTPEAYRQLDAGSEVYSYSYLFDDPALDQAQRTNIEEDMVDALLDNDAVVSEIIDADDNQAIGYALDDVTHDQIMWTVLLFILVVIMAFVFVVLTSATIESESAVIGTMLASGWRKGEIVRHYMVLPAIVGICAIIAGLAVGLTLLSDPMKGLYYHSYSLPPYEVRWNWRVVFITAVVPYLLLVGITLFGLLRKMKFTPLQFLRHEVASRRRNASIVLPSKLSYAVRFRLRVLLRNASHFVTLFFGIMFASLLLLFGICMLPVVQNYALELRDTVAAPHQYVLKTPLELEGSQEEVDRYAAQLRLLEDHDRIEANQDAVDALDRLKDNDELVDAIERLQENQALLDAADRLQDNQELADALDRLEENQELLDAADRLQDNQELMDVLDRLQANQGIMDAAMRMQAGSPTPEDAMLLATADAQTMADLQYLSTLDQQTLDDIELVSDVDEQTRADLDLLQDVDEQTRADLDLLDNVDEQTEADLDLIADLDEQTRADLDLVRDMDDDLLDDLRLASDIDEDAHVVNTQENDAATIEQAEKFAMGTVEIEHLWGDDVETVSVYGIQPNSRYWTEIPVADGHVVVGRGLAEKTPAKPGGEVELVNRREGERYAISVAEEASNEADTNMYMTLADFNRMFDNDADYFNAYASAQELALDGRYVANTVVPDDMTKMSTQLEESMGKIVGMMMCMSVPIYLILVFLLTKTVIDRSARSISYMKVFGYHSAEVNGLYIRPITYWVLFSLVASIPLIVLLISVLLKVIFMSYSGNFPIIIPPTRLVALVVVGMVAYALVAILHVRRIRRVPLEIAMKVQE